MVIFTSLEVWKWSRNVTVLRSIQRINLNEWCKRNWWSSTLTGSFRSKSLSYRTALPNLIHPHRSFADQDTDRWVLEVLAPDLRRETKGLKASKKPPDELQWTDHMYKFLLFFLGGILDTYTTDVFIFVGLQCWLNSTNEGKPEKKSRTRCA